MMNSNDLQVAAWDAEDNGEEVYVSRHDSQEDVILYVEINGETLVNDFVDQELQPYDFYAEGQWRE